MRRRLRKVKVRPDKLRNGPIKITPTKSRNNDIINTSRGKVNLNDLPKFHVNKVTHFLPKSSNKVFIIGGGPRVKDFNFSLICGHDTICVNKSIDLVEKPTYFITMDYSFFTKVGKSIPEVISKAKSSHFIINKENTYIKETNGVILDTRSELQYKDLDKFTSVIDSNQTYDPIDGFSKTINKFCHGQNSGFCAIQFALLAGYEEIYLVGFDLDVSASSTHFHNDYGNSINSYRKKIHSYHDGFKKAFQLSREKSKIFLVTTSNLLQAYIPLLRSRELINKLGESQMKVKRKSTDEVTKERGLLKDLVIVAYYTVNTLYEAEANKLKSSLDKLGLVYDIVGVDNLGNWQANTRFKAHFMEDMLKKHAGKNLLYVDSDAIIHKVPILFENYNYDIAVRWQDFRWRKNECLSGTIFMANNERTLELCKRWQKVNIGEGPNAKTFEQWNLGKVIVDMRKEGKIKDVNLPPEYTMIFDSMRAMYPSIDPVIEHFQASRKLRNKV